MSATSSDGHIFDLDGVLWNSNSLHKLTIEAICQNNSLIPLPYETLAGKPSNEVQIAAVHKDPYQLRNIIAAGIEPSEDVQKVAVKRLPTLLKNIVDAGITLSKDVQIAAIGDIPDREKKIYDFLESMKFLDQFKSK